jgi:hypothetical protein
MLTSLWVGTPRRSGEEVIAMRMATENLSAREALAEHEQKRLALGYLQEAWTEASHEGIEDDCLAQTALFLALAELTSAYGEEAAARFAENLGPRIRNGEFSVDLSRQ